MSAPNGRNKSSQLIGHGPPNYWPDWFFMPIGTLGLVAGELSGCSQFSIVMLAARGFVSTVSIPGTHSCSSSLLIISGGFIGFSVCQRDYKNTSHLWKGAAWARKELIKFWKRPESLGVLLIFHCCRWDLVGKSSAA